MIKQISVFMENKAGRLHHLTKCLGQNNIDLVMLTIADTAEFGIVRIITKKNEEALKVLKDNGFTATLSELVGIEVDDRPSGLSDVLSVIKDCEISVEYLYSFARSAFGSAIILLKVENLELALKLLKGKDVKIIENLD